MFTSFFQQGSVQVIAHAGFGAPLGFSGHVVQFMVDFGISPDMLQVGIIGALSLTLAGLVISRRRREARQG